VGIWPRDTVILRCAIPNRATLPEEREMRSHGAWSWGHRCGAGSAGPARQGMWRKPWRIWHRMRRSSSQGRGCR
jgi:hypothetical protein